MNSGTRYPIACAPDTGKRVAIVGAGPAGLSAAQALAQAGFWVTILEAHEYPGGMVGGAIPEAEYVAGLEAELGRGARLPVHLAERHAIGMRDLRRDGTRQADRQDRRDGTPAPPPWRQPAQRLKIWPLANRFQPAPPPGHPYHTIPWVAGRGSGPEPRT